MTSSNNGKVKLKDIEMLIDIEVEGDSTIEMDSYKNTEMRTRILGATVKACLKALEESPLVAENLTEKQAGELFLNQFKSFVITNFDRLQERRERRGGRFG